MYTVYKSCRLLIINNMYVHQPHTQYLLCFKNGGAGKETPGLETAKTLQKILEYFVTQHTMKWRFRTLYSAIGLFSGNPKPLLKRNKYISSFYKVLEDFWRILSSGTWFFRPPFWMQRRTWGRGCRYMYLSVYFVTAESCVTRGRALGKNERSRRQGFSNYPWW